MIQKMPGRCLIEVVQGQRIRARVVRHVFAKGYVSAKLGSTAGHYRRFHEHTVPRVEHLHCRQLVSWQLRDALPAWMMASILICPANAVKLYSEPPQDPEWGLKVHPLRSRATKSGS